MIEVKNLCAGYDNKQVLNNLDFALLKGECLSVIGKNGCGKSTLLKVLCGVLDYQGEVLIDGVDLKSLNSKELAKKVCLLSQFTYVHFNYSVYDTVMMGRFVHQKGGFFSETSKEDVEKVDLALKVVDLYDLKDITIDKLSGGQLQRVMLAKIIAQDPEIVLLDEPTNHLDLVYQIEFIKFLKAWGKEENKTIIGVLHDINLALDLAPKTMLLDEGNIKAFDVKEKVFSSKEFYDIYKKDVVDFYVKSLERWKELSKN